MTQQPTLDPQRDSYASLATFRRDGREVRTPVWFAESDGRLYVFSEGDAGKVKRIRATRRVRLAACNVRGRVHGVWIDGSARVVDDAALVQRAYAALRHKYGVPMRVVDFLSRLTGRYERRAILEIDLAESAPRESEPLA